MKTEKISLPICEMYKSRGVVNLSPPYQRGSGVWNGPKKKDLIYSILRGYDLAKIYIHANASIWDVVDGKQRLTTIFDFLQDAFPLNSRIKEFNRQKYSQLPADTREAIDRYLLDLTIVTECGTDQIREMFLLHQQGSPLTSSERRNAIGGWLHGEVNRLAEHPYFMQCAAFVNRRFKHQHVIASCFLLETVGKASGTGHVALRNLYTSLKVPTDAGRTTLAKVNAVYDLLADVFKPVPGLALSAGATIALYWLVASNGTRAREFRANLADFYQDFEFRRRNALLRKGQQDVAFLTYTQHLAHSTKAEYVGAATDFLASEFDKFLGRKRPVAVALDCDGAKPRSFSRNGTGNGLVKAMQGSDRMAADNPFDLHKGA